MKTSSSVPPSSQELELYIVFAVILCFYIIPIKEAQINQYFNMFFYIVCEDLRLLDELKNSLMTL